MRFLRAVAGCKLVDQKTNVDIRAELNIYNLVGKIKDYRQKRIAHMQGQPSTKGVALRFKRTM